ncbi:MAG: hypothetical protein IPJ40_03145 [Saprospirales bacterium]|nr:hypothetical protein [Saprospirales bacterium]
MYDEGDTPPSPRLQHRASADLKPDHYLLLEQRDIHPRRLHRRHLLTILAGQYSATTIISLTDDALDEGDEVMVIRLAGLPVEFLVLNDNIPIRVVDNDFQVAPFGTPSIRPTAW